MANHLIIRDDNDLEERYTPDEMYNAILDYFAKLDDEMLSYLMFNLMSSEKQIKYLEENTLPLKPNKPTSTGLALHLGFASRYDMNSVQQDGAYALIIRRGISMIEEFFEQELYSAHCGGAKFWLKNHGWVESQPKDFGTDKVFNVMIDAEVVKPDKEKEKLDMIELKGRLKDAGLDIIEKVEVIIETK